MGKRKTKGLSPPSEEYSRFKNLLRRLVAVPRDEAKEKMPDRQRKRTPSATR